MKVKANFIYLIIIVFLVALLIIGHQINKKSSASKKNEISNIVNQLKTRNNQLAKIQKNLFKDGKNLNDIISKKGITFENIFKDKKLDGLNNFSYSKYSTKDILFNGNRGAIGTAYIDFYNDDKNLLIATYDGIFAFTNINNLENFVKINSNINSIIKYDKFYFHEQYGIKDIHIDNNKLYVSYIGERKDNCYDLKIIFSEFNEKFLDFNLFYQTLNCVDKNNNHGFWAHQGAGGRIVNLDSSNLLFTTGDFRNRPLSQDIKSDFGKILKINIQNKNSEVVSLGHRNPQGLYYSKKFDFILSTEHGPKGGDEININNKPFLKVKNFGWPISSYGKHYAKNYSDKILKEAPLNKSHKKFGFEEPIKYFDPSIGISQTISLNEADTEFLIGAMGNEIADQDLGLHYIKLNENRDKVIEHDYFLLNERVRDMVVSKDKKLIIIFLESTSSISVLKKNS
ncbi:PQQ-dependent sugar dehydrogenase [Candidatus Pelagibacter sp.]|uniref:PQQ-dependent sugar dehydrogenase n=1 Tax=Candidatus Pelagibacter sp. TaxID=2024849 RepID=UPI003F834449